MAKTYDVIVAGGGHNGLTVACYLAKAGLEVCVVEHQDKVGGAVISREGLTAPGFISDPCSTQHHIAQFSPTLLNDELELKSKYGLQYIYPPIQESILFEDGSTFNIYLDPDRTADEIARKYGEHDGEAYRKFYKWASYGVETIVAGFFNPAPAFGLFASMMDSSPESRELLRATRMSCLDMLNEWFESDKVKAGMMRWMSETMVNPAEKGTGLTAFTFIGLGHRFPGTGMPVGGSGKLSEAMEAMLKDHGATIMLNSTVNGFIVEGGECKGVTLTNGEELRARKMVVADLHIKQVERMLDKNVDETYKKHVERLRPAPFMAFQQSLALHEAPKFIAEDDALNEAFFVEFCPNTMLEFCRMFDDLGYGIPGMAPLVSVPTLHDPSRAPEGKHVMYLYEYAPYKRLDGRDWDDVKDEYAQEILDHVSKYCTNMGPENIIGKWIMSPKDLERMNPAMINGDIGHIGSFSEQMTGDRPLPHTGYTTPVDKLMMCGPSTHPGCGVTCGGRAAATAILEELGFMIDDVVEG